MIRGRILAEDERINDNPRLKLRLGNLSLKAMCASSL